MRLIDADVLLEEMYKYSDNEGAKMPYGDNDSLIHRDSACFLIENAPTIEPEQRWIPCSERLPEERDSIFAKLYGTEKWRDAMFRKTSKTVIITVEHLDGTRQTAPCHTIDGEWNQSMKGMGKVIAWQPLPDPWKEEKNESQ